MKITVRPTFYFSAYPLKAITASSPPAKDKPGSPYLKALLSEKTTTCSRVRVFPITNPYNNHFRPAPFDNDKLPKDIELTEKDWFNNYE